MDYKFLSLSPCLNCIPCFEFDASGETIFVMAGNPFRIETFLNVFTNLLIKRNFYDIYYTL